MENPIYKIFIFNSNTGELLKTENYSSFPDVQEEVIQHNSSNQNNRWNLHIGTEYPPKGVKFDDTIKQFVNKTLSEQYEDGELQIPPDFKIVNNTLVRLTKKELYDKGLLKLEYDEKIDELDSIIKLTKKEMYDIGKITKYQVYEYFIQELNLKIESKLKKYYNYPMQEMGTWEIKKNQSIEWLKLSVEEKLLIVNNSSIIKFDLIVSESGVTTSDNETIKLEKIDLLSNKVITKFKELETIYGSMFALRSNTKKEFEDTLLLDNINIYNKMEEILNNVII